MATFVALACGTIASPKLQGWINEAINTGKSKGFSGQSLCAHIREYMDENHGKYWHCSVTRIFYVTPAIPNADNAASFDLDGEEWIVFKSGW